MIGLWFLRLLNRRFPNAVYVILHCTAHLDFPVDD